MTIIPRIAGAMQHVLATVGDTIARGTGFVKRKRKLSGAKFVQTLVFTWACQTQCQLRRTDTDRRFSWRTDNPASPRTAVYATSG